MPVRRFWPLPKPLTLAIQAPEAVLRLLADRIMLEPAARLSATRVVSLTWDEERYQTSRAAHWQPHFSAQDVVWKETPTDWLFLGDGFSLGYAAETDSAHFFVTPERWDDVFTFSYPFLNLLIKLLTPLGYAALHAGVVGSGERFALIPGKQNSGKSTTTATWLLRGGSVLTDDFCFVPLTDPTLAHGFYPTLRLREPALPLLAPALAPDQLQQQGDSKYFFSLLTHAPERFVPQARLRAVFCLSLHAAAPSHAPASAQTGFEYLASSVVFSIQNRGDGRACLEAIKKLVRELPVLRVNLSPNPGENFGYLKELLEEF